MRFPYVLGGLWNGQNDTPPLANVDGKNDKRIIMSRKKHYLLFDDGKQGVAQLGYENGMYVRFTDDEIVLKETPGQSAKIANKTGAMTLKGASAISTSGRQRSQSKLPAHLT